MFKTLFVLFLFISVVLSAPIVSVSPEETAQQLADLDFGQRSATVNTVGIAWNPNLPINNDTINNATLATKHNHVLLNNGNIGAYINATMALNATHHLVNGTLYLLPKQIPKTGYHIINATVFINGVNQTALALESHRLNEPTGCELTVQPGFTVDPFIGEYCYFGRNGGFIYRGIRSEKGELILQRYKFWKQKRNMVNVTVPNNSTNTTVVPDPVPPPVPTFVEIDLSDMVDEVVYEDIADAEVDLDEVSEEEDEELEEEEEDFESDQDEIDSAFLEVAYILSGQKELKPSPINNTTPLGSKLPKLKTGKLGQCSTQAEQFVYCRGGGMFDQLSGSESVGFCQSEQSSAVTGLKISKYTQYLDNFKGQLQKFSSSGNLKSGAWNDTSSFNPDSDGIRFCFVPGTVAHEMKTSSTGIVRTLDLGNTTGMFKPVLSISCKSDYCKDNGYTIPGKSRAIHIQLIP